MLKKLSCLFVLYFVVMTVKAQEPHFLLDPTLNPEGTIIVFSHDSDLWKVPTSGGVATRLTGMRGEETLPRISPDGQWLAFSSNADGNDNIYVMPLKGGNIEQLTFHDGIDEVDSWSWDSKMIYFTSNRENRFAGYKVSRLGGTPKRLFKKHYFENSHNIAVHPITAEIFFNESWESKFFANRKRYKGAYNPDIKSYNPKTEEYKEYTSYNGKDMWSTFDKSGKHYFVSDEANGEYNLYTFEGTAKTQLTTFDTSIGRPQVSANGNTLIFTKDYQLYRYDVNTKQTNKVSIQLANNSSLEKLRDFNVSGNITYFSVSPDNKKLAFISRGELFVSDVKGKFVQQIPIKKSERAKEVLWLTDNKTLLYTRTDNGYTNIFTVAADGSQKSRQYTRDARNNVNLTLDDENKKVVYISGRDELRLLDLNSFKSTVLVKDEFWALYAPKAYFSPDGSHVVYTAIRNFESDVFTIRIADKKITNLTKTGVTEAEPIWSPDGKYVYFSSNLTKPLYPYGLRDGQIYQMALDKYEDPYTLDKYDALFEEEAKDGDKDENVEKPKISIREEGIMERIKSIGPSFGLQTNPQILSKDEVTYVLYLSNHDEGNVKLWKTTLEPFKKNEIEKVMDETVRSYQLASSKGKHYVLVNGNIHTLDIEGNSTKKIDVDHTFRRNLSEEFHQMFYEAWAGFEENFYDENFHGEDWEALRKSYGKYLPYVTKRSHLRLLFNDMLGELNTSHFGFRSSGSEEQTYYKSISQATGIQFSNENPFVVDHIIKNGPADVLGKDIRIGDKLVAVNGNKIDETKNRESYFVQPSLDQNMALTFERKGMEKTVKVHPVGTRQQTSLLYDEWVAQNQKYVDTQSKHKVAYIHMKNMGAGELERFKREMVSEAAQRDALILDLRYNTGGNVHDEVLQFLSQRPYLKWKYREGKLAPQPNFGPAAKPIIILINEQSLSDAEMTSAGFKALQLGTLIGTETYRWIVFTSGNGLVDGSFYRLPSWGCYTLEGKNLEKEGVKPDIFVPKNFKDRVEGNHPQLDRALLEITKQWEEE